MEKLYQKLLKYYSSSAIILLLSNGIFYSVRTKTHDILQIVITQIDPNQYIVEQTMMCGYNKQSNKTLADVDAIVQHICSLQMCVC